MSDKIDDLVIANNEVTEQEIKSVSYETHRKLLDEAKKAKLKANELDARLAELQASRDKEENDKLVEQKRFQDVALKYEKENALLKETLNQEKNKMISHLKTKAIKGKLSTINDKYLLQFADLDSLEIDENNEVNEDSIDYVVEKFKQEHPVFFQSNVVKKENKLATNTRSVITQSDIKGLTSKELLELYKKGVR
jgi:hypothetical protein